MKRALFAIALGLLATPSHADRVLYLFDDFDLDEVYNVSVLVEGDSAGLATYNVALSGLADAPIDATTIDFVEAPLMTLAELAPPFGVHGFSNGLLKGNVGVDGYSAVNSQFNNPFAVYGVGQSEVSVTGALGDTLTFGAPTLLGTLSIPGANGLATRELRDLLTPNAALFVEESDPNNVGAASEIVVGIQGLLFPNPFDPPQPTLPSPSSVLIDFNEAPPGVGPSPYVEDGVTMTVTPHPIDGNLGDYSIGILGIDGSGTVSLDGSGSNNAVSFSAGGAPFTLHSIDFGPDRLAFDENVDVISEFYRGVVRTSDGFEQTTAAGARQVFSGAEFTDITSFTIYNWPGVAEVNFDNIVVTIGVPEPAAGAIVGFAAAGLMTRRRAFSG